MSAPDTAVNLPLLPRTRTLSDVTLPATHAAFGDMTLAAWVPAENVVHTQGAASPDEGDTAATLSFPLRPDSNDMSTARIIMEAATSQQVETARPMPHQQPADDGVQQLLPAPRAVPESDVALVGAPQDIAQPADSQGQTASAQGPDASASASYPEPAAMTAEAQQQTQTPSMLDQLLLLPTVLDDASSDPAAPVASAAEPADATPLSSGLFAQPDAHSPPVAELGQPPGLVAVHSIPSQLITAAELPDTGDATQPSPVLPLMVLLTNAAPQPAMTDSLQAGRDSRASAPSAMPIAVTAGALPEPYLSGELQPGAFDEALSDAVSEAGSEPSLAAVDSLLDPDMGEGEGDGSPRDMEALPDTDMGGGDAPPSGVGALPSGHPLLARAQAALLAQLQATRLRLEQELSEKRKALKARRVPVPVLSRCCPLR